MRVLTQGYVMYPWFIKLIFVSFFVSQVLANYIVVQRWILPRDILKKVPLRTLTSCVMECSRTNKCTTVGFRRKLDHLSTNDTCLMVNLLRKETKNGTKIKIYALIDQQTAEEDEKKERIALVKQQSCPLYGWPEGAYGILTREKCPKGWYEYTQCYMAESGTNIGKNFSLNIGECKTGSSMTLRYCFKGSNVSSRAGGFFTKSGSVGTTYVIRNVGSPCTEFGSGGGCVYIDSEDTKNKIASYGNNGINLKRSRQYYPHKSVGSATDNNVQLYFCIVGEKKGSATSDNIRVGKFNQKFGLFSSPHNSQCPVLASPHGILHGNKEIISFHSESKTNPSSKVTGDKTPFVVGTDKYSVKFGVCVYNP